MLPFVSQGECELSDLSGDQSMNRLLLKIAIAVAAGNLLFSSAAAQGKAYAAEGAPLPASKTAHVHITQGPELESAHDNVAIIRWRSNNPGGSDEHYAVVHYGTNPKQLSQIAKSHIRLNQTHTYTVFRVRIDDLKPRTTYYYTVDSMEANGRSDGVKSPVRHFTTP
jgi:phosphodiesterase/alkaline phosphatase D-like protein